MGEIAREQREVAGALGIRQAGRAGGAPGVVGRWQARRRTPAAVAALCVFAAALVILALVRLGPAPPVVVACGYVAVVTMPLTVVDLHERRLPNALVVPGFAFGAAGLAWQWLARGSPPWGALGWCVAVLLAFGVLAVFGGVGMGDVKLAGMLALALGAAGSGAAAVGLAVGSAFVAAGVAAVAMLVLGRWAGPHREIPFGPFLLAGFWVAVAAG
ncbi:prepilin peptidase [Leifsonia sp. NPDC058230]|uniref:prepilin peptidase n=1 Tax=Leifsonia sp. NPDC058230 TaxID=3346391 RepID=UPI0036D95C1B